MSAITCQIQKIYEMPLFIQKQRMTVVFVLDGNCHVKRFSQIEEFKEGDVFFINRNEVVSISSKLGCVVEWLEFDVSLLNHDETEQLHILTLKGSLGSLDQKKDMSDIYRDCVFTKNLLLYALSKEKEEIFNEICEALISDYQKLSDNTLIKEDQRNWVLSIHAMILKDLCQKISLQDLAEQMNMKKSNLATQYKQFTGMTLLEWSNLQRLMKAEELLMFDDLSHQEIIRQCGFSDSKYFYRYFMEEFHMTPAAWKEKMKSVEERQVDVLTEKEADIYLNRMMNQLSGLKTETELYRKAVLIRHLSNNKMLNKEMTVELDLLHQDNYIEVADERINAWYGFDLIMNELKKNAFTVEMKITLHKNIIQEEIDELFMLIKRSSLRFPPKITKCWNFVVEFYEPKHALEAKRVQHRIESEFNQECTVKCV